MAAGTTDMRLAGSLAQSVRRVEGEIAQVRHVGLVAARRLRMKDFAWIVRSVLIEFTANGQAGAAIGDRRGVRAAAASQPNNCGADEGGPRSANSRDTGWGMLRFDQDAALIASLEERMFIT